MRSLRVLIVEDSEDDAELVLRTLRKAGYEVEYRCSNLKPIIKQFKTTNTCNINMSYETMSHYNNLSSHLTR